MAQIRKPQNEPDFLTDLSHRLATNEITRHPELWLEDGSVILVAEKTAFRVHRSLLSSNSSVLGDMFGVPQPTDQDSAEGCPIVLIPDPASELSCLLKAIYQPSYFIGRLESQAAPPFDDLVSILRLSTKYEMVAIRSKAIIDLQKYVPRTLVEFDAGHRPFKVNVAEAIRAIKVGHESRALVILPCLYYYVTAEPTTVVLNGIKQHHMGFDDILTCLTGRDSILKAQKSTTFAFVCDQQLSQNWTQSSQCKMIIASLLQTWLRREYHCSPRVLHQWESAVKCLGFCSSCFTYLISSHEAGRAKAWELLPTWFNLGTWQEIDAAHATDSQV